MAVARRRLQQYGWLLLGPQRWIFQRPASRSVGCIQAVTRILIMLSELRDLSQCAQWISIVNEPHIECVYYFVAVVMCRSVKSASC